MRRRRVGEVSLQAVRSAAGVADLVDDVFGRTGTRLAVRHGVAVVAGVLAGVEPQVGEETPTPCAASMRAVAAPMPWFAPVTIATRPVRPRSSMTDPFKTSA